MAKLPDSEPSAEAGCSHPAEGYHRVQKTSSAASVHLERRREINAACVKPAVRNKESIGRKLAIGAENTTGTLPKIGDDHDIGFLIAGASFQPCLPLTHIIGGSHV